MKGYHESWRLSILFQVRKLWERGMELYKGRGYGILVFLLAFFLMSGSVQVQAEIDESPRTFTLSDQYPYPGKFNTTLGNHPINTLFPVYIYIVNQGGQVKPGDVAKDIKISMITDKGDIIDFGTVNIPEGEGYTKVEISWPVDSEVVLKVTGTILKNGNINQEISVTTESNGFWIGTPIPEVPQKGKGTVIWEKEIL